MEKGNSKHSLTIMINSGGLNQIYLNPKDINTSYEVLEAKFLGKLSHLQLSKENIEEIIKEAVVLGVKGQDLITGIEKAINQKAKDNQSIKLRKVFSIDDYQTNDIKYVQDMSLKSNIIIIVSNHICLLIETIILSELQFIPYLTIQCTNEELNNEISSNPKSFFVFDYDLERLFAFNQIGTWTAYLTNYIKIQSKDNLASAYSQLNLKNLDVIRSKGIFFNFSVFFFIQMIHYSSIIIDLLPSLFSNKSNDLLLKESIKKLNPINCLVIYRYLFKAGEIRRAHLFISNSKVNYISYIGSIGQEGYDDLLDLSINTKDHIDCLLPKFSEVQELTGLNKMITSIQSYCQEYSKEIYCINSLNELSSFLIREKMVNFMQNYCQLPQLQAISTGSIAFPLSYSVNLLDVYTYDQLKTYMQIKNLKLPLILKYTGPKIEYNHLLINIITEEGLKNYIKFIQEFTQGDQDKISIVMQSYINHGGYVIKLYRINHQSYVFYRPSFPDAKEELVIQHEEYKRGFYQTFTSALVTKEFNDFWNKLSKNSNVKESVNEAYLNSLADVFEEYSHNSLIGMDFLYDYENNVYYLIDVNCFPGYKEMIGEFNDHISNHIEYYYKKSKE